MAVFTLPTFDIPTPIGPIHFDPNQFNPSGPSAPTGCPPGTVWRGVPWQSNVCDPISGPTNPNFPIGPVTIIPTGPAFNPSGSPECIWPWRRDPITGECSLFIGSTPGPDPGPVGNGGAPPVSGSRIHGEFFHADQPPVTVAVNVRRCPPGHVLGKDRWCHPKGSIPNKERLYPKPPRPLGSVREMKCVTVAGQFARRLKSKKKTLKKVATALGSF